MTTMLDPRSLLRAISTLMYGCNRGSFILAEDWDHLLILDNCRHDLFSKVFKKYFKQKMRNAKINFECRISRGASTFEFIYENFVNDYFTSEHYKDVIYISANPVVDYALGAYRNKFFKYVAVWQYFWNKRLGTVHPSDVYIVSLKYFIKYPKKRLIIHFLQPHPPFIDKRFSHLNKYVKFDYFCSKETFRANKCLKHEALRLLNIITMNIKTVLSRAAISSLPGLYFNASLIEITKAFYSNLRYVLPYVLRLVNILPGINVITTDHGEAFGEYIHPLLPIRVYAHPSYIHIESLVKVPWIIFDNRNLSLHESLKIALKDFLAMRVKRLNNYF